MAGFVGEKPLQINWTEFDKLCFMQATLLEISAWYSCSEDTIERAVHRAHGMSFAEYHKQKSQHGKISMRRKMFQKALEGDNTMLIWLSKQYLGFKDKHDVQATHNVNINILDHREIKEVLQCDPFRIAEVNYNAMRDVREIAARSTELNEANDKHSNGERHTSRGDSNFSEPRRD